MKDEEIVQLAQLAHDHPIVKETVEQYMRNMGIKPETLQALGLWQCLINIAVIAICNEKGIDPKIVFKHWNRT